MRKQSSLYYSVRDELRRHDPGLTASQLAQLARALIDVGAIREVRTTVRTLVGPDGSPFVSEVQP